jgi:hypothetical protein
VERALVDSRKYHDDVALLRVRRSARTRVRRQGVAERPRLHLGRGDLLDDHVRHGVLAKALAALVTLGTIEREKSRSAAEARPQQDLAGLSGALRSRSPGAGDEAGYEGGPRMGVKESDDDQDPVQRVGSELERPLTPLARTPRRLRSPSPGWIRSSRRRSGHSSSGPRPARPRRADDQRDQARPSPRTTAKMPTHNATYPR